MDDDDKISKLQAATDEAESQMKKYELALKDSQERVDVAKLLLQQIPEQEQSTILISDTRLPELLQMHSLAKEEFETAEKRYETNKRYLTMYKDKAAATSRGESEGSE